MSYSNSTAASDKQVSYIHDLFDQKNLFADPRFFDQVNAMDADELARHIEFLKNSVGDPQDLSKPRVSRERASGIIENLKALPNKQRKATRPGYPDASHSGPAVNTEIGMYIEEDRSGVCNPAVFRVYLGQQSGRNLVKRLVDTGQPHPEDASINLHDWEYVGAADGRKAQVALRESRRMTLDEAKEYGRMTGSCCRCGRRLDVPESVEAGIGPVCAGKVGEWA